MSKPETWRLFFAIYPDSAACERAAGLAAICGGTLTPLENLHLTLLFLGSVPRDQVTALEQAAAGVCAPSFLLSLQRLECARRGISWLAPAQRSRPLCGLHDKLYQAVSELGFALEARAYRPHLTLARRAQRREPLLIDPLRFRVERFSLVRSLPVPGGVRYQCLREWTLAPRD